jgi:hypothetical protein
MAYGEEIVATLSRQLAAEYGAGFSRPVGQLFRNKNPRRNQTLFSIFTRTSPGSSKEKYCIAAKNLVVYSQQEQNNLVLSAVLLKKQTTYRKECVRVETENRSEIKAMETE